MINRKFKFSLNTRFISILRYENNHISLVVIATHEIFIFIPLDKIVSVFINVYRKILNIYEY
jgi:hypothetical protein